MLPTKYAKHSGLLLLVFVLCGCAPRPAPPESPAAEFAVAPASLDVPAITKGRGIRIATKEERAKARIPQVKAIQMARKAFGKANIKIEKDAVPEAYYVRIPTRRDDPEHFEWRVFFVPKNQRASGLPSVRIDDKTGSVTVRLGR